MAFEKAAIENATAAATGEVCHGEKKYILSEKCYPSTTDTEINCFLSDRAILAVH